MTKTTIITVQRDPAAHERTDPTPEIEHPPHRTKRWRKPEAYKVDALWEFAHNRRTKARTLTTLCAWLEEYMRWAEGK